MYEIADKRTFATHVMRMVNKLGTSFEFHPPTFRLPYELDALRVEYEKVCVCVLRERERETILSDTYICVCVCVCVCVCACVHRIQPDYGSSNPLLVAAERTSHYIQFPFAPYLSLSHTHTHTHTHTRPWQHCSSIAISLSLHTHTHTHTHHTPNTDWI